MRLLEFEAKTVFKKAGIPIPQGHVANSGEKAAQIAAKLDRPVVVKAQVLVGGRGKAGGIKAADSPKTTQKVAKQILAMTIHNHPVYQVLIEEQLKIAQEIYLGLTVDRSKRHPVAICSVMGGVDIEQVAQKHPEKIAQLTVDPFLGLQEFEARQLVKKAGLQGKTMLQVADLMMRLWHVFVEYDAELTEINPLVITSNGQVIAADARLNIDDNSLFRHNDFVDQRRTEITEETELEHRANTLGMTYVELKGNIGIIGNGAGLVMATMDAVQYYGGAPANFLDVGGGATADRMTQALEIVISHPNVQAVFINILGGITRCDEMALGIVAAQAKMHKRVPIVIRMIGTREQEGAKILQKADIPFLNSMDAAARRVVEKVTGSHTA